MWIEFGQYTFDVDSYRPNTDFGSLSIGRVDYYALCNAKVVSLMRHSCIIDAQDTIRVWLDDSRGGRDPLHTWKWITNCIARNGNRSHFVYSVRTLLLVLNDRQCYNKDVKLGTCRAWAHFAFQSSRCRIQKSACR